MRYTFFAVTIILATVPGIGFAQEKPLGVTEALGASVNRLWI